MNRLYPERPILQPCKLKPSAEPPAFLPTTVSIIEAGVTTYSHMLPPGLNAPIGTRFEYRSCTLRVLFINLCIRTPHPADHTAVGMYYALHCETI